jgi:hypothetical protein
MTTSTSQPVSHVADPWMRVGALAGIIGPPLFTTGFLLQNLLRDDDDAIAEPVSALGAGDLGWIQGLNFAVFAVLMLTFAIGLHRGIAPTRFGWLGPALLGVSAGGLVWAAAFPLDRDAAGEIFDPGLHNVAGVTFFLSTALALLVLPRRLGADPRWRSLSQYALLAGAAALTGFFVLGLLAIPEGAPLHDYAGVAQRSVIVLVTFPCLVTLALRLRSVCER